MLVARPVLSAGRVGRGPPDPAQWPSIAYFVRDSRKTCASVTLWVGDLMSAAIAIGCVLLAVSAAQGQFEFLEQVRTVRASATIDLEDYPLPGEEVHLEDIETRTAPDFGLFDETVMASVREGVWSGRATAWQHSNLTPTEIIARGGPRDVLAEGFDTSTRSAAAASTTRVTFRLDAPAFLHLHAEILDPPSYDFQGDLLASGDVSFSLTGPNLEVVRAPRSGIVVLPEIPPIMTETIDETHAVGPGDYLLNVSATYGFRDSTYVDVYYDVQLSASPIPEPNALALALLSLGSLFILRRYVFAHFGK